ncbi:MAG: FecR domain-containing protein [Acidobacteriaceae bacterium]|nr:FecR domain-containing protein [Acidobacteriaceae bacterium]
MSDEYLWSSEGEPDAQVTRLEGLLRPLAYSGKAIDFHEPKREETGRRAGWLTWAAAAAIAAAACLVGWKIQSARRAVASSWTMTLNGRAPQIVRKGETIETGKNGGAHLESDFVGEVEVGPETKLQVLESTREEQRLALRRGTLHAFIWAPAREFVVDTPAARTVDLGCAYSLHVAPDGTGLLTVEAGWVAFQWRNLESFIPAGAACATRPERGPGTPHFEDASPELEKQLARFDRDGDGEALRDVLELSRPRDALTLWHLLGRTRGDKRAQVFDRFAGLVKLPATVTREKILEGDAGAMDAAWNALGFGDTDWWRGWKRPW